jgi:hypothetical protein
LESSAARRSKAKNKGQKGAHDRLQKLGPPEQIRFSRWAVRGQRKSHAKVIGWQCSLG